MTDSGDLQHTKTGVDVSTGKGLTPGTRRHLEQCYQEAMALLQQVKYDHDRAHELLSECILADPNNLGCVDALLVNLDRKFEGHRRGLRIHLLTGKSPLKLAMNRRDWTDVLRHGLDLLKHNPWDWGVLNPLAQACAAREHYQAELRYLENALEGEPDGADINRHLAKSLARLGRCDEALECWRRVELADPYDAEAPGMISQLTLEKTRRNGQATNRAEPEALRPNAKADVAEAGSPASAEARTPAAPPPRKAQKVVLTHRQQLEQAIVNHPEDESSYLELAELHLAEHRTFDAQRTLLKALNHSNDVRVLERLEDVNMLRAHEHLEAARKRSRDAPSEEAHQLAERLKEELGQLELEIFTRRCERNPQDSKLKFQLGLRLKQVGKFREALEPLQGGLALPEHRAVASLEIGEILQGYKQFPKALQCYRQAVQLAASDEHHQDCRKRALYRAGMLAMNMKLLDSARQYLSELVQIDPEYHEARTHLDKLNEIGEDF